VTVPGTAIVNSNVCRIGAIARAMFCSLPEERHPETRRSSAGPSRLKNGSAQDDAH
jgi:hypothetical protein